jgi:formate-nitrite transporter family protein
MTDLNRVENEQAEERMVASAKVVHEVVVREGLEELDRSGWALAWSGLAAGFAMGLSMMTSGFIRDALPDTSWRHMVVALGYPMGFVAAIIARQQVFTENPLRAVVPLLETKSGETLVKVVRLWSVILVCNVLGAWVFAFIAARTSLFEQNIHTAFAAIGTEVYNQPFWDIFIKAVFAGWIIALMSWMMSSSVHSKFTVIFVMTYLIGLAKFKHVIAGSVDALYLVSTGAANFGQYLSQFFWPTLLGNVVGGVALVAIVNHAQVTAGSEEEKQDKKEIKSHEKRKHEHQEPAPAT